MSGTDAAAEEVAAGNRRSRALGPQHSQVEDPPSKVAKEGDPAKQAKEDAKDDKDMKQMMEKMMGMMGTMDKKMDDVTTKVEDAVQIAKEAKDSVKLVEVKITAVQGEVDSMNQELKDSQKKMDTLKASIEVNIAKTSAQKSEVSTAEVRDGQGVATAYIGGLSKTETFEEAAKWFEGQLKKHGIPKPIDMYIKDEQYRGRPWARFPTEEVMGTSIALFQSKVITHGDAGEKAWCSKDLPHHMWTSRTFLAGFKNLLTST